MSIRVSEMVGVSSNGWKSAVQAAVDEASRTVGDIVGVEIVNFTAQVEDGQVKEYRANVKIAYK